jgi:hypothetical protein
MSGADQRETALSVRTHDFGLNNNSIFRIFIGNIWQYIGAFMKREKLRDASDTTDEEWAVSSPAHIRHR